MEESADIRLDRTDDPSSRNVVGVTAPNPITEPDHVQTAPFRRLGLVMLPYVLLLVTVLAVLLPPWTRAWAKSHLAWGPSFPAVTTGRGAFTPAVTSYQSIALLAHPGAFILLATGRHGHRRGGCARAGR